MRHLINTAVLLSGLFACAAAHAATVQGRLELQWGDSKPVANTPRTDRFQVNLVTDAGVRLPLDPAQALRAAEDLYALAGKRVAVEFSAQTKGAAMYRVEVIVPADTGKAGAKILGNTRWVTLMCKFSDIATEQKPLSFFQSQYDNSAGRLDHYWREVSYNKINLVGSTAVDWVTLPQPRSFYVTGSGQGNANLNQLFIDCTAAADSQVDFAAGGGAQGINMMFNGDLDGFAWGGSRCQTLDGLNKCWSSTWNPPWAFGNLAPLAHEMGHGYGLPHANNSDGDSDPYDNPWDVMSDAWNNATSDATYGTVAKHINVYSRDRLGWIEPARKLTVNAGTSNPSIQLDRASLHGSTAVQMLVVRVPGEAASNYYTVEARKRVGTYDGNLAGNAVIIHRVQSRQEPSWSMDASVPPANRANNEGSMFKPGELWNAPGNTFSVRVLSENTNGFVVAVCAAGALPTGFHRFDPCSIGPASPPSPPIRGRPIVPITDPNPELPHH